jgi:hypothetical protein
MGLTYVTSVKFTLGCYSETGFHMAWIVILSVYGADTIAETKLLISTLPR